MMRFARVASVVALSLFAAPRCIQAQPAAATDQFLFYAGFTTGVTFGHKSAGALGAEGGFRITDDFDVFVEAGHLSNVGTQDLDTRAERISRAVGATFSAAYKVNYFDVGVRYHWPLKPMVHPYVGLGLGVAGVRSETVLSIGGTAVPPQSLGIQFGSDLNGSVKKALVTLGGGVTMPFAKRYFGDLSYRYARIAARTGEIENDQGINTNRLQVGVGVKF